MFVCVCFSVGVSVLQLLEISDILTLKYDYQPTLSAQIEISTLLNSSCDNHCDLAWGGFEILVINNKLK